MNYRWILAGCALSLTACAEPAPDAEALLDTISQENIYAHVEYLANDSLEGRMTGEAGYDKAAKYVAERFSEYGLEPGGDDGWYQQVPLQTYLVDTDSIQFIVHGDDGDQPLTYREDFTMGGDKVRAETSVTGELVYVGRGVHAPDHGYSDYEGIDVDGKIAVGFSGAPDVIEGDQRAYHASSRLKTKHAVERGAVGFVSLRSRRSEETFPWERAARSAGTRPGMAWVGADGSAANYWPQIIASAYMNEDTSAELFADAPITFEQMRDAMEANEVASTPLGITVTLARNTNHERIESPNVIGIVRGTDPKLANEYVVYTGHLDHTGIGAEVDGDKIYNGMYDNAMGIALMLEAARVIAQAPPKRSVMFIALTAEERGLLGSDYFVHYPTVPGESLVANVNIDMPLFIYPLADVVAFGAQHSSLFDVVERSANAESFELSPDPIPEENIFLRSDQYSFVRAGIPAVYLSPGFTSTDPDVNGAAIFQEHLKEHYHRPSDDLSLPIDWDSAIRFARANARIGWDIANDDMRPAWNEGNFFGETFAPKD